MSESCHLGGIVKHKNYGFGFKISFNSPELAQNYKEMIGWFVVNDKMILSEDKGYYDRKK